MWRSAVLILTPSPPFALHTDTLRSLQRAAPARASILTTPSRSTVSPTLTSLVSLRALSTEARSKIDSAVKSNPLVVFMKGTPDMPMCGFSRAVIQVMQVQGVKPELLKTFNCLEDQELREGIKEYSDWPTIPQVYVDGEFVGGCDILINSKSTLPPIPHWILKGVEWIAKGEMELIGLTYFCFG